MGRFFQAAKRLNSLLRPFPKLRKRVDSVCAEFHHLQQNANYDLETNGERWLLETLARHGRLRTAFDVGANHGDWAALALAANPGVTVHCFEVCPPTFQKLAARFDRRSTPNLHLNPVGLSEAPGKIEVKYCPDNDGLTTFFEVIHTPNVQIVGGDVIRGKDYCAEHNLASIDMLKIDVEGAEHLVLRGFDDLLAPDKVSVVQFEYGLANIMTKFLLRDFYLLLQGRGYRIGKLFPTSVRFRDYRFEDEDFIGPNFVAANPAFESFLNPEH